MSEVSNRVKETIQNLHAWSKFHTEKETENMNQRYREHSETVKHKSNLIPKRRE